MVQVVVDVCAVTYKQLVLLNMFRFLLVLLCRTGVEALPLQPPVIGYHVDSR